MFYFINNEFIPAEQAVLHVSDLSIQRGYGVFDFLKVKDGHPFFMDDYLDRFYHSARLMNLSMPLSRKDLIDAVYGLIAKNGIPDSGIKLVLTGGYSPDGYSLQKPNLVITQQELVLPARDVVEKGVAIMTHEYVREFAAAKTINYTMGIWLLEKIRQANVYDVLYVKNNLVSEFPRSNFFLVRQDDTVITPSENILRGVTRKNVLGIASKYFRTEEGEVTREDLSTAKEAFITSTTKRILPVVSIDKSIVGAGKPGEISTFLLSKLIELESGDAGKTA